jgi:hypothetical protein
VVGQVSERSIIIIKKVVVGIVGFSSAIYFYMNISSSSLAQINEAKRLARESTAKEYLPDSKVSAALAEHKNLIQDLNSPEIIEEVLKSEEAFKEDDDSGSDTTHAPTPKISVIELSETRPILALRIPEIITSDPEPNHFVEDALDFKSDLPYYKGGASLFEDPIIKDIISSK